MKKELNIADILKDSPNAKLFDRLRNRKVQLNYISDLGDEEVIWCNDYTNDKNKNYCFGYSEYGTKRGYLDGLQILKPSKEMQDWSKFAWKKGDVLCGYLGNLCIFDKWANDQYTEFYGRYPSPTYSKDGDKFDTESWSSGVEGIVKITFIKNIEEHYGGKLNLETLEIEQTKQEFKDGDIVYLNTKNGLQYVFAYDANKEMITSYIVAYCITLEEFAHIETQYICRDSMVNSIHLATDSEKQQLFAALKKEGKVWNPDTKQIEDLSKMCEFNQMDLCLMSDGYDESLWNLCQFAFKDGEDFYHSIGGGIWRECIPYNESTKHLLGTTKEWKGGNNG